MREHKDAFVSWISPWLALVPMRETMTLPACLDTISQQEYRRSPVLVSSNMFVSGPFSINSGIFNWELVSMLMLDFVLHSVNLYARKWKESLNELYSNA